MHYFSSFSSENLCFAFTQTTRNSQYKRQLTCNSNYFELHTTFSEKLLIVFANLRV